MLNRHAMHFDASLQLHDMGDATFRILVLPIDLDTALRAQNVERVVVTLNERLDWHAPLLSLGEDRGRYVVVSAERRKALGLQDGETVRVHLREDTSTYGMPVPEEWTSMLEEEPALRPLFDALTPGQQRRLLYHVGKPKREATRIKKAVGAADYLLRVGPENFDSATLPTWSPQR